MTDSVRVSSITALLLPLQLPQLLIQLSLKSQYNMMNTLGPYVDHKPDLHVCRIDMKTFIDLYKRRLILKIMNYRGSRRLKKHLFSDVEYL